MLDPRIKDRLWSVAKKRSDARKLLIKSLEDLNASSAVSSQSSSTEPVEPPAKSPRLSGNASQLQSLLSGNERRRSLDTQDAKKRIKQVSSHLKSYFLLKKSFSIRCIILFSTPEIPTS
jgi:hypothetical protein